MIAVKRGVLMMGCAVAFAAGSLLSASPALAKECPWGTTKRFEGVCTQAPTMGQGASNPGGQLVVPPAASPPGAPFIPNPNGVGTVLGIPCTPENYGKCIALQQSQGAGPGY